MVYYQKLDVKSIIRDTHKECLENILKRNFTAQMPNQKCTTDITYIKTDHGILFLSVIKDLYDGCIVSYKMSKNSQTDSLVDKTIR